MTESTRGEVPDATYIDGKITLWVPGGKVTDVGIVNLEHKIRDAAVEIMTYFMAGYPLELKHNLLDLHFDKVREVYTDREDGEEYVREERRPVGRGSSSRARSQHKEPRRPPGWRGILWAATGPW